MSLVSPPPSRPVSLSSSLSLIASSSCRMATERVGARSVRSSSSPDRAPFNDNAAAAPVAVSEPPHRLANARRRVDDFDPCRVLAFDDMGEASICRCGDPADAARIVREHNAGLDVARIVEAEFAASPIDLPDDFEFGQFVDWDAIEARRADVSRALNALRRMERDAGTAGFVALAATVWMTLFFLFGAILHFVPLNWIVGGLAR